MLLLHLNSVHWNGHIWTSTVHRWQLHHQLHDTGLKKYTMAVSNKHLPSSSNNWKNKKQSTSKIFISFKQRPPDPRHPPRHGIPRRQRQTDKNNSPTVSVTIKFFHFIWSHDSTVVSEEVQHLKYQNVSLDTVKTRPSVIEGWGLKTEGKRGCRKKDICIYLQGALWWQCLWKCPDCPIGGLHVHHLDGRRKAE